MAREMGKRQQSFWGWSAETWFETVGPNSNAFRKQAGRMPDIRRHLIAISYLLCDYSEIYRIGQVNQPIFAAMIFGKEIIDLAIERVGNELKSWGHIGARISNCTATLQRRS
jgi:hypothetical protein